MNEEGDCTVKFFNPTSKLKELLLLQHIEENPDTTQQEIAKVLGSATSMVNVYIDKHEKEGYMLREYKSPKVVYYNITSKGVKRKNYLSICYIRELLDLYQLAKENVEKFLHGVEDRGFHNILLYGAGEVAETILSVIRDSNQLKLNVLGVIDDNKSMQDKELLEYKIISREDITKFNYDAVIVTSYTYEDEILEKLKEINFSQDKIIRFFDYWL